MASMEDEASLSAAIASLEKPGGTKKKTPAEYTALVRWCGKAKAATEALRVHACLRKAGLDRSTFMANLLLQMYGRCGNVEAAMDLFHDIPHRDSFSFTFIIAACVQNGQDLKALRFAKAMAAQGLNPNKYTFVPVLAACANLRDLAEGTRTHARIESSKFSSNLAVKNALINMYGKCGSLHEARSIFDNMPARDLVTWNSMLTAYAQNGAGEKALALFRRMEKEGIESDKVTFLSIVDACASVASLEIGRAIHEHVVRRGFESHRSIRNALINMYAKCRSVIDARAVFDRMVEKDVVSWSSMISGLAQNGNCKEAIELFQQMQRGSTKPNKVTLLNVIIGCASTGSLGYGREIHKHIMSSEFRSDLVLRTALIDMYGKCGCLQDARIIFDEMHEHDVISWTAMIAAYAQNNNGKEALKLFREMKAQGIKPNRVTFLSLLDACSSLASLERGRIIHEFILTNGIELDVFLGTALVNMYSKCGNLEHARSFFDKMTERNLVAWNSIMTAYAQNGQGKETLELYLEMQIDGIIPDRITFLSVLKACSHAGLLDEGREHFACMTGDYSFIPLLEHYVCMIDLLGRAGCLEEAADLITSMPMEPTTVAWYALLVACRIHKDVKLGVCAAKCAHELDLSNSAPSVLLSHIYAAAGR